MVIQRSILTFATLLGILLGIPAGPAFAQDGEKKGGGGKGIEERWKDLDDKTREERREILKKMLEGKNEQQKKEILDKLKDLERKTKRDRIREKQRQYEEFRDRLLKSLSAPLRARYDKLDKNTRRHFTFHFIRRVWEAGGKRFMESLTEEEKKTLDGLSGRARWTGLRTITDERVRNSLTLETKKELDALPEAKRTKRFGELRTEYIEAKMRLVEIDIVFPEAAELLQKPEKDVAKAVKHRWSRGSRGNGRPPSDQRPHHKKGVRFPDKELHDLLHKLPEKLQKTADEEYLRIVAKHRDPQSRKKALDEFKAKLQKLDAD